MKTASPSVSSIRWIKNTKTERVSSGNFYRAAIPQDITDGQSPNPSTWGKPGAELSPIGCNPISFFSNHSIIFGQSVIMRNLSFFSDLLFSLDITFCGDWAGNSYATSGCPGTCADRITDPANFVVCALRHQGDSCILTVICI